MNSENKFEAVEQLLKSSPKFDVRVKKERLIVDRRRVFAPRRGVLRLLLPRTYAVISERIGSMPRYLIKPDSLAIFMVVMLLGGLVVEIFFDRTHFPREYPPAFIYGLAAFYIGALIADMTYTWKQLQPLFDKAKQ